MGMLKENRIGIPKDIKDIKGRAEKSTIVIHNNNGNIEKMMVSYVDKKKSGLKNILVLSTMHDVVKLSRDERKKPHVMVFYDKTKGGVDVVDYISSFISTRMKSKRWIMNAFAYSLDTARTNALTLFKEVHTQSPSNFTFTWNLGKALVFPRVQRRHREFRKYLPATVVRKLCNVLGIQNNPIALTAPNRSDLGGRCYVCYENIKDKADYKRKRNLLNNHLKTFCHKCTHIVCKEHYQITCGNCVE